MTLLVYNTLTTLIFFDTLDKNAFEISKEEISQSSNGEDSDAEAEEVLGGQASKLKISIVDKRKGGKKIEKGGIVSAKITKMQIAQGNIVLYASLQ